MGTGHSILKPFETRFKPFVGQPVCCCQIPLCHNLFRFWFLVTRCFRIPYMGVGHSKRPLWTQYLLENGSWAFKAPALNPVFLKMGVGIQSACFEPGIFLKVAAGNHMQMLVGQFWGGFNFFHVCQSSFKMVLAAPGSCLGIFLANSFCRHSKRQRWTNILTNQQLRLGTHSLSNVKAHSDQGAQNVIFTSRAQTAPWSLRALMLLKEDKSKRRFEPLDRCAPWHRSRGTNLKVSSPLAPLKCPLALQPSQAIKGNEPVLFDFAFEKMLPFAVLGAHAVEGDESKSFIPFNRVSEL